VNRRTALDEWISTLGRAAALLLLVAFGVVWILTRQVEPLLVAAMSTIYGIGRAASALVELRRPDPRPPPTPSPDPDPAPQAGEHT
jgi:hypothetical protein